MRGGIESRRPRGPRMRPVYRPSLVAPWRARVISMYAGLAGCGVLVVMVGKGVISRDWVSLQGSITVLVIVTVALFCISLGIIVYENYGGAPAYSALPLSQPEEEDELPPVLTSQDLIALARTQAQQRFVETA